MDMTIFPLSNHLYKTKAVLHSTEYRNIIRLNNLIDYLNIGIDEGSSKNGYRRRFRFQYSSNNC
jgi:hypothetical protein